MTLGKLSTLAFLNLLDPMTFYSWYAWFQYIDNGNTTSIPMIPLWGAALLPNFRLGLTPFGPEVFLENFLMYKGNLTYFYIKGGSFASNRYYGFGIENKDLWCYN